MKIYHILAMARDMEASDVHLTAGEPIVFRIHGKLTNSGMMLTKEDAEEEIVETLLSEKQKADLKSGLDIDFALETPDRYRYRVNIFMQQSRVAGTIRLLNQDIPSLEDLQLPPVLKRLAKEPRGLVLITGPTGSGKSTTLASMIEMINQERAEHIITIEDPIEYRYEPKKSIIHQREVGIDTVSFGSALRSALREDPDGILVGEMRDYETICAAVTAAETGHLVFSTLHTTGAAQTIDRIVDACPAEGQNQIRTQLAGVLKGVVTQCLLPTADGQGRVVATEVLTGSDAALNQIRENKCFQLNSTMQAGKFEGMHTLNGDLTRLMREGKITSEIAYQYSNDKRDLENYT
jgi:twitching motility protein PilT